MKTKQPKTHPTLRKELLAWLWKQHGFSGDLFRAGPKYVVQVHDVNGRACLVGTQIRSIENRSFDEWAKEIACLGGLL